MHSSRLPSSSSMKLVAVTIEPLQHLNKERQEHSLDRLLDCWATSVLNCRHDTIEVGWNRIGLIYPFPNDALPFEAIRGERPLIAILVSHYQHLNRRNDSAADSEEIVIRLASAQPKKCNETIAASMKLG